MRFARLRIRTLLVATASVATGYAAVLYYIAYMNADRLGPIPRDPAGEFATAAAIAAGTHVTILGVLALLPRMTPRRWMIVIAIAATLVAVKVYLSRLADEYRAIAEYHESQSQAVAGARHWSGSLDGDTTISIGCDGCGPEGDEELKGRDLAMFLWHERLSRKYDLAALRPWTPVPPDPPEPN